MKAINNVAVFGATSAIAQAVCRKFIERGASLYCVGRNQDKLDALVKDLSVRAGPDQTIESQQADLNDTGKHAGLMDEAERVLGSLDAVLIAHGSLPEQEQCQASFAQTRYELETNAISVISLLTEAANLFERKKQGAIAVISSVAGDRGRRSNYVYGAAKGMVSIFMAGLRNRLFVNNVSVTTIKPGFVDTPMTEEFEKSGPLWAKPDQVAAGIVRAMVKGKDDVYLPWFWRWIMLIIRHIPERIFKRLSL